MDVLLTLNSVVFWRRRKLLFIGSIITLRSIDKTMEVSYLGFNHLASKFLTR